MAQRGPLPRISQGWNQGTIWAMFLSEGLTFEASTSTSSRSLVELVSCDCGTVCAFTVQGDTASAEKAW